MSALTTDHLSVVLRWLQSKNVPHVWKILFAGVAGSSSYNVAVNTSDTDYFAVYAPELRSWCMATRSPADCITSSGIEEDGLDVCVYDPIKYAGLLLKGNPKVVEPLFSGILRSDMCLCKKTKHFCTPLK